MAVQKVDYEDKIGLQNDPNVPDKSKVTDEDMNQLKSKINNNADELNEAQGDIEDLQQGQGTTNGAIASLKNRVSTLEADNTKNKQDIANKVDKVDGKGLSTEDYTTAEKQKLAGLNNYDDTEIKEDIQDIKSEQTTQNTKLQELEDNQIHITTERASNLNVQDASGQNAKINIFGISKQETRSGKNKFDVTKLENVENIDSKTGSFAIKAYGTWIMAEENVSKLLKPNTQYKCIADVTLIESPQNVSEGIATLLALNSSSAGSNAILSCSSLTEKNTWQLNETKRLESSFTTASDLSIFNMIHYGYHTSDWQATGKFKFENIMILEATEEDETFEEYGESPSPKYHSEIENTTGNVKITSCNKNLFNKNTVTEGKNIGNNGEFVINNNYFISDYILINKNVSLALTGIEWGRIAFYDKDKNFIKYSANAESNDLIATSTEDTKYAVISSIIATIDNVQLEVSNTATEFEVHEEEVITFPLSQNQKMFKGDYLADDGIHNKRKQIELDGTENWALYAGYANNAEKGYCYYLNIADCKIVKDTSISTHFKNVFGAYQESVGYIGAFSDNLSVKNKYFISDKETLEKFKAYLAEQKTAGTPVKLEYELETEEIEAYTEEQQTSTLR